jgi:hypothetical protein
MQLKSLWAPVALVVGLTFGSTVAAQAPAGSTGECKDGTYTSAEKKRGACAAHGGVKSWYGDKKAASSTSKSSATEKTSAEAAPASKATKSTEKMSAPAAAAPAAAATSSKGTEKTSAMPAVAAAGGGPGKVWVNTSSKVYHCSGDEWYGKTKEGAYMSESDAKAKGNHAAHGKACS